MAGFYPSTFVYNRFPPQIQFLQCLLSSLPLQGDLMVDTKGKMFEIQVCRLLENAFFSDFYGNFSIQTYIHVSFMRFRKYLNQRVRRIGKQDRKRFFKNKKKHMKRLSFITQFKIEFLPLFTGCRKVLGKILEWYCEKPISV